MVGKKRGSPGAETEKDPLAGVELNDEDEKRLTAIQKETARMEIAVGKCYVIFAFLGKC
jgi:template-activating factor I